MESKLRLHADVALSRTVSLSEAHWQRFRAKGLFGIDGLLANSRLSQRLVSLHVCAARLVGLMLGWCRIRCRTFLEYGLWHWSQGSSRGERVMSVEPKRVSSLQSRCHGSSRPARVAPCAFSLHSDQSG